MYMYVDDSAVPKFHKARPVPNATRSKVEKALQWLVEAGILQPIQHSDWVAPTVSVLNKDLETVRIRV